jgi:ParB-like chromosome segregation protein Spo0J
MSNAIHRLPVDAIEEVIDYNNLVAHDLANLMPMIEGKKFEELVESVRKGLQYKIVLFEGRVLDGRNRYRALKTIGHAFTAADFETFEGTRDEAETKVIDLNMIRRQMTNKDKEEVIRRMILKYPDESYRGIARKCGITSHA